MELAGAWGAFQIMNFIIGWSSFSDSGDVALINLCLRFLFDHLQILYLFFKLVDLSHLNQNYHNVLKNNLIFQEQQINFQFFNKFQSKNVQL